MFFAKPVFVESFPKVNELLYNMTTSHLLEFKDNKVLEIGAYADHQRDDRTEVKKEFETTIEKLISECENVCQAVRDSAILPDLEDMDPAKLGQRNKKKSMVQQKLEEQERRHKLNLAEEHRGMLGYYIRLIDYMAIETLVSLLQDRVKRFYENLMDRKARIFSTTVSYGKDCMIFIPNREEFREILEGIIENMISDINGITRLIYHFDEIVAAEHITHFPQVEEIIKNSESFLEFVNFIMRKINIDFEEARIYVDNNFEKARHVNDYVETWNFDVYKSEGHTVQAIKDELNKIKEWLAKDIPNYVPSQPNASVKGILHIDGKKVRLQLTTALSKAQDDLKSYLNSMALEKALAAVSQLEDIQDKLKDTPSNLSQFVTYVEYIRQSGITIQNIEASKNELDEIEKILKREKGPEIQFTTQRISEVERYTKNARIALEGRTEFITQKKPDMEKKLLSRIEKMKAQLTDEIAKKLDEGAIILVDATPAEALLELKKIEQKLKKCENNAEKFKHYQDVFETGSTKIKELEDVQSKFQSKQKLWTLRKD